MTPDIFEKLQLILVFVSVMCGVVSAVYFYQSTDIFMTLLKKPLRLISSGMIIMTLGVMLAAVISYESSQGIALLVSGVRLDVFFYLAYIIGSFMILLGARKFAYRPRP